MTRHRRAVPAAGAAALAAAVLAACGSSTKTTTTVTRPAATTTTSASPSGGGAGAAVVGTPGSASSQLAQGTTGTAGSSLAGQPAALLVRPFSSASPWNTTVDTASVDASSDALLLRARTRIGVQETGNRLTTAPRVLNDGLFINTTKWTDPVVDTASGTTTQLVCRQLPPDCGDGPSVTSLPIPSDVSPLPQYDGWFTVEDRANGIAYDMWRARRARTGTVISYQFMRAWSLNGPGFQTPNAVSARGSGLPLFAGLVLPEEIQTGRIEHALAISLPGPAQRTYVQPASSTDGVGDLNSLPEGARIRLKAGATLGRLPPRTNVRAAQAIFQALRRYGAIVVDRSRVPTLYAKLNFNWSAPLRGPSGDLLDASGRPLAGRVSRLANQGTPLLRGNEVQGLRVSDFEVVSLPPLHTFPPLRSTQAATVQTFTPVVP